MKSLSLDQLCDRDGPVMVHGSAVEVDGRALLITGPSGAGKSALALQMMALGAGLIADDRTILHREGERIVASCPDTIRGMIEARGIGILPVPAALPAPLCAIMDLSQTETERLPEAQSICILGNPIRHLKRIEGAYVPAALVQYLRSEGTID
ncbi:MAG: HPr kinase/phosphatase C-terminal domain-containing protein [Pseudomonadota bacterium]|nr:HPr kinase/phosphatase C-terminal domain-containing protein [Pseudomonadota bacterium]MEE3070770.1 HPr kinase/phosphatase C-terminal domain-containing protein [Pseudomonadota bacterium]